MQTSTVASPPPGTSSSLMLRVLSSTTGSMTLAVCHEGPPPHEVPEAWMAPVAIIRMPCIADRSRHHPVPHLGAPSAAAAIASAPAQLTVESRGTPAAAAAADIAAGGKRKDGCTTG